jgi:hypothetical protein
MEDGMLYYIANRIEIVVLKSEMLSEASLKLAHNEEENEHKYSRVSTIDFMLRERIFGSVN